MKGTRQSKILELINNKVIITQEELQSELEALGFNVTQSTVSRDIKELKIIKGHDSAGNYRYISVQPSAVHGQSSEQYREMFSHSVKSVDYALNNVVIKCYTGMASSVCVAVDSLFNDMMIGSLAGDDTIIVVTADEEHSVRLTDELKKMI